MKRSTKQIYVAWLALVAVFSGLAVLDAKCSN